MSERDNVQVCCRFRPFNAREAKEGAATNRAMTIDSDCKAVQMDPKVAGEGRESRFILDHFFAPESTQEMVYQRVAKPLVESVMGGYNCTVFAYGQTGSGKTFTMTGVLDSPELRGLVPRLVEDIFNNIGLADPLLEFTIKVSFVEIYMEVIRDLLDTTKTNLRIREGNAGVWIEDVTEIYVGSPQEVLDIMKQGQDSRAVASTLMNIESSRSHSVFMITIGQRNIQNESKKSSKLILVDLAGSEKVGKTGAEGQTLNEAKYINKSLSALGNVINSLTENSKHIPYRDSKLTRLLSDSLGGNSKTSLIVTASPSVFNSDETISTLRFGTRAKRIKNNARVNQEMSVAEYKALLADSEKRNQQQSEIIAALERDIAELRQAMTAHGLNPDSILTAATVRNAAADLAKMKAIAEKAAATTSSNNSAGGGDNSDQPRGVTFDSDKDRDSDNERDKDDLKPERPKGHRRNASMGAGTAAVVAKLQEQLVALEGKNSKLMEQADLLRDQLAEREMVMSRHTSFATKYDEELAKMKHDLLKAEERNASLQDKLNEFDMYKRKVALMEKEHALRLEQLEKLHKEAMETVPSADATTPKGSNVSGSMLFPRPSQTAAVSAQPPNPPSTPMTPGTGKPPLAVSVAAATANQSSIQTPQGANKTRVLDYLDANANANTPSTPMTPAQAQAVSPNPTGAAAGAKTVAVNLGQLLNAAQQTPNTVKPGTTTTAGTAAATQNVPVKTVAIPTLSLAGVTSQKDAAVPAKAATTATTAVTTTNTTSATAAVPPINPSLPVQQLPQSPQQATQSQSAGPVAPSTPTSSSPSSSNIPGEDGEMMSPRTRERLTLSANRRRAVSGINQMLVGAGSSSATTTATTTATAGSDSTATTQVSNSNATTATDSKSQPVAEDKKSATGETTTAAAAPTNTPAVVVATTTATNPPPSTPSGAATTATEKPQQVSATTATSAPTQPVPLQINRAGTIDKRASLPRGPSGSNLAGAAAGASATVDDDMPLSEHTLWTMSKLGDTPGKRERELLKINSNLMEDLKRKIEQHMSLTTELEELRLALRESVGVEAKNKRGSSTPAANVLVNLNNKLRLQITAMQNASSYQQKIIDSRAEHISMLEAALHESNNAHRAQLTKHLEEIDKLRLQNKQLADAMLVGKTLPASALQQAAAVPAAETKARNVVIPKTVQAGKPIPASPARPVAGGRGKDKEKDRADKDKDKDTNANSSANASNSSTSSAAAPKSILKGAPAPLVTGSDSNSSSAATAEDDESVPFNPFVTTPSAVDMLKAQKALADKQKAIGLAPKSPKRFSLTDTFDVMMSSIAIGGRRKSLGGGSSTAAPGSAGSGEAPREAPVPPKTPTGAQSQGGPRRQSLGK